MRNGLKISLITPAGKQSRNGNRTTAVRWQDILRRLGHEAIIATEYENEPVDAMIAVHAWRSAKSILRFRERYPDRPLIVLLAGTDINKFQQSHPDETYHSMDIADALVCLHGLVHRDIPDRFHGKLHVIHQSALPLNRTRRPSRRTVDICVIGHLREEKDPLRAAEAARLLPDDSRIRIVHLGKAHDESWAERARREMSTNPRYDWRGEAPGWQVRRLFDSSHAMVLSSIMEGGANVVSEAVAADVPVIASDISGSIGLLGEDYAGYFPVGDTAALAACLDRIEHDRDYLKTLTRQCRERAHLFKPQHEEAAWRSLLAALT